MLTAQSKRLLNNAVLSFGRGHPCLLALMDDAARLLQSQSADRWCSKWGVLGPDLVTRGASRRAACKRVVQMPPVAFSPVKWQVCRARLGVCAPRRV